MTYLHLVAEILTAFSSSGQLATSYFTYCLSIWAYTTMNSKELLYSQEIDLKLNLNQDKTIAALT